MSQKKKKKTPSKPAKCITCKKVPGRDFNHSVAYCPRTKCEICGDYRDQLVKKDNGRRTAPHGPDNICPKRAEPKAFRNELSSSSSSSGGEVQSPLQQAAPEELPMAHSPPQQQQRQQPHEPMSPAVFPPGRQGRLIPLDRQPAHLFRRIYRTTTVAVDAQQSPDGDVVLYGPEVREDVVVKNHYAENGFDIFGLEQEDVNFFVGLVYHDMCNDEILKVIDNPSARKKKELRVVRRVQIFASVQAAKTERARIIRETVLELAEQHVDNPSLHVQTFDWRSFDFDVEKTELQIIERQVYLSLGRCLWCHAYKSKHTKRCTRPHSRR